MTFLSKVKEVFEVTGRGCVLSPALGEGIAREIELKRADAIELRKPDGSVIHTVVNKMAFIDRSKGRSSVAITLPPNVSKSDIPIGTEIWLVN